MKTPIFDYVNEYISGKPSRFHMPGHKGVPGFLGVEPRDLTEIDGADELYLADGIILESEEIAGSFFNAHTFYSTEGSSLSIRAALALVDKWSKRNNPDKPTLILAGRNAHKTLVSAAVLLDLNIDWIMPKVSDSYESCQINADELRSIFEEYKSQEKELPSALYLTSPDYLGNILDIGALAKVCHEYDVLLLVDNAHGAYLKFLEESLHPMDLGADIACDSAHKTLPVLTGGAYLHVAKFQKPSFDKEAFGVNGDNVSQYILEARKFFKENANSALALFGSTSPSYLILQSLDVCNVYLESLSNTLMGVGAFVAKIKQRFVDNGYRLCGNEPIKITLYLESGKGKEIAEMLYKEKIVPEYYDKKHLVFMVSSQNTINDMNRLVDFFDREDIKKLANSPRENKPVSVDSNDRQIAPKRALSFKEAYFAPSESILIKDSIGRIMSEALLSCPPAVPLFMSGEIIDERILTNRDWLSTDTIKVSTTL